MNTLESTLDKGSGNESDPDKSKKKSRKVASKVLTKEVEAQSPTKKIVLPWEKNPEAEFKLFRSEQKYKAENEKAKENSPEDVITSEEKLEIESRYRREARRERGETGGKDIEGEALNDFDSKIIEEGLDSDIALSEVLENLGISEEEIEQFNPDDLLRNEDRAEESVITDLNTEQDGIHDFTHEDEVWLNSGTISSNSTGSSGGGAASSTGSSSNWAPSSNSGGAGGGGRGMPPTAFGGMGPNGPNNNQPGGVNANLAPATNPNAAANTPNIIAGREQAHPATMALFGSTIGYLIGRRRGRIKTEKKLLPIQKKLEKQVEDLGWQLKAKELKIREAAREKSLANKLLRYEKSKPKDRGKEYVLNSIQAMKLQQETVATGRRHKAPEANQLHGLQNVGERIGHVVIAAESLHKSSSGRVEQSKQNEPTRQEVLEHLSKKRIETISRPELLKISEKIIVGGSTLRKIYETHLIGEKGLRRLVNEHFNGGDLQKALRKEIVEKEIDFERDPALRDMALGSSSSGSSSILEPEASSSAFKQLMLKAEASVPSTGNEMMTAKTRDGMQVHAIHKHEVIDKLLTAIIIILAIVVTFIYFAHR